MANSKADSISETHPCVARWLETHGTIELGWCSQTKSFVRIFDEGGLIWKSGRSCRSLDVALRDCETAIGRWLRDELGEKI
jgi:hypothetical protein